MIRRLNSMHSLLRLVAGLLLAMGLSFSVAAGATAPSKSKKPALVKSAEKVKKSPSPKVTVSKGAGKKVESRVHAAARAKPSVVLVSRKASKSLAKREVTRARLAKADRHERVTRQAGVAGKSGVRIASSRAEPSPRMGLASSSVVRVPEEPRVSFGEKLGLKASHDPLDLNSSVALVVDQDTSEVLFSKNDTAVLPIASLTKLMTGLVIADANLPMDEMITISEEDAQVYRNSRLAVGTTITRGELMHLALMSSENRAANALGRTFPGGGDQFVRRMNAKAKELGMRDTRYVEPTGLSSMNQSSARDLATLVSVAYERPILRNLSTSPSHQLELGHRTLQYNNSNRLIRNPEWEIGLQKTGYISEAGRCLVMQAKVAGRKLIMVFLDSAGKLSRAQDAERVRRWVEAQTVQQLFTRPQG